MAIPVRHLLLQDRSSQKLYRFVSDISVALRFLLFFFAQVCFLRIWIILKPFVTCINILQEHPKRFKTRKHTCNKTKPFEI